MPMASTTRTPSPYDRLAQTWFNGIQALSLPPPHASSVNANMVINGGFEVPICPVNSHTVTPAAPAGSLRRMSLALVRD